MRATVSQLKTGLKTALSTINGLRAYDYQPDQVNPPFAWPILESIEYHSAMSAGLSEYVFKVSVVVGRASERVAQSKLDQYLASTSGIASAIEADPTLGGVADSLIVQSADNISTIDANDSLYLVVDFRVVVYA